MKPLKIKVSITLDEEIINEIKKLAEQDDRSFSQYVNLVLKEYLKEKLPSYKMPNKIYCLEKLPLNRNGKLDRAALGRIPL